MAAVRGGDRDLVTRSLGAGRAVVPLAAVALTAVVALAGCADPAAPRTAEPAAGRSTSGESDGGSVEVTVPPDTVAPAPGPALSPVPPPAPGPVTASGGSGGGAGGGTGGTTEVTPGGAGATGFVWTVSPVTAADLPHSWREGCPVPPSALRAVTVGYHSMAGGVTTGVLVIHQDLVEPARRAFERLFQLGFPFTSIRPVDDFGGDDDRSMAADNTSAFNCRAAVSDGPTSWSKHAYGRAIDVNPLINPYVLNGRVLPPEGARHADRRPVPGMLTSGGDALKAFTANGFSWGGTWSNPDYQHLQR